MKKLTVLSFVLLLNLAITSCSSLDNTLRKPALDELSISKEAVGIYTGSFDPPTNAHKKIMTQGLENYPITKLLIFVNVSGSKDFKTSFAERREMILGMLGPYADRVEVRPILRENVNETMEDINKKTNTVQFIGQDSFEALPSDAMTDPNRRWVVIPRGNEPLQIPEKANAEALAPIDDTSSSQIRALIIQNKIDEANIDPFVRDYITEKRLYVPKVGVAEKMKVAAFEKLFSDYKVGLKKAMPGMDLSDVVLPVYLPDQSVSAWSDKFTNLVIKKRGLVGAEAEKFRVFSHGVLKKIVIGIDKKVEAPCSPGAMRYFFSN